MKSFCLCISLLAFCLISFVASAQEAPPADGIAHLTIKSEVLGEERVALIRTPPGYERNNLRYPVLYMTDGNAQLGHTISTVDFLVRNGRMPQLIIVAINNTDRTRDLTPTRGSFPRPEGGLQPLPTSGGADKFLKFIETELIPKVENQYRTHPYRIFAGHSFGGLFALHAFFTKPDLFNAYIAVSPTMHWDNDYLLKRAEEFFSGRKELNRLLFFTMANEDEKMIAGFNKFKELCAKQKIKGFEWGALFYEDEDHGSVVLRSHYAGLRKVFDQWLLAPESLAGGLPAFEEHYKKLSAKFNYPVQPPEFLVNNLGYQLMGKGHMNEAITTFKSNVERYPNSANVYDSLAEAYERSGKLDLAKTNYEKAVQLGQQNNDPNLPVYKTNYERTVELVKKNAEGK